MAGQGACRRCQPGAAGRGASHAGMTAARRQTRITDFNCWPAAADEVPMAGLCAAGGHAMLLPDTVDGLLQADQDIVDLLQALQPTSVTAEGGLYAAAVQVEAGHPLQVSLG